MIPISVCIIGRNEEQHIDTCLSRLAKYPFEIVYVDTGSTDRTKELAAKYTSCIYDFAWCDDFSAARNYSLEKASNNYILVVDCDEYLETANLQELDELIQEFPLAVGQIVRKSPCYSGDAETAVTDYVERIFDRRYYHYTGIIHEQVTPRTGDSSKLTVYQAPLTFTHVGYFTNQEDREKKAKRNISLLEKELQKKPDDPYLYYQIGESYQLIGDYERAYQAYDKGFYLDVDETLPYVRDMITSYGHSMLETDRAQKALTLEGVYEYFQDYADFVYMMGNVYLTLRQNQKALDQFLHALELTDHLQDGTNSFLSLHNIGCIYEAYEYYDAAKEAYQKAADMGYAHSQERLTNLINRLA